MPNNPKSNSGHNPSGLSKEPVIKHSAIGGGNQSNKGNNDVKPIPKPKKG